jgi:Type III restriction enzyme, res subunit
VARKLNTQYPGAIYLPATCEVEYAAEAARSSQRASSAAYETFTTRRDLRLLEYNDFARYCVKMVTGSGKTKVMSLVIAWQFFNAVAEARGISGQI